MSTGRIRHGSRIVPVLGVVVALTVPIVASGQEVRSAADVREQCELIWNSLRTFQFTSDEFNLKGDEPDFTPGYNRFEFWQAPGGRRAFRLHAVHPDGMDLASEFRQDGRRRYEVDMYDGNPDTVNSISILDQPDSDKVYEGMMNQVLWLLMPAGKPVHVHIEEGARVEIDEDGPEGLHVEVISTHRGKPLRIVLDPQHDWLPREVVQEGSFRSVVTEFGRDNGRWFPVSGWEENQRRDGVQRLGFSVIEFHLNGRIPSTVFRMPEVEEGVAVTDATGKSLRGHYEGGPEAREARNRMYAPASEQQNTEAPLVVPRADGTGPLVRGLAIVGIIALCVAVGLYWYRRITDRGASA